MQHDQSLFVLVSGIYLAGLYIFSLIRSPRFMDVSKKEAHYDLRRMRSYLGFLAVVLLATALIGYMTTRTLMPILEVGIVNIVLSGLIGTNIFLLRFNNESKSKSGVIGSKK